MTKTLKICLFWHNLNSTNYGVSALAIAHLNLLVDVAKETGVPLEIETWGTPSAGDLTIQAELEQRLGIKIVHHTFGLRQLAQKVMRLRWGQLNPYKNKGYDLVFDIGEGDSFADIYGLKRFILFSLNKFYALTSGIPLIIAPQTLGPFKHALTSRIAAYLMKRSQAVYVRDHKSSGYLTEMGIDHHEVSDVAFLLPFDPQPKKAHSVGLNVSGLLWQGGYTQDNQFNLSVDYPQLVLNLIRGLIERGQTVYLVGHVISDVDEIEDDYRTLQHIKQTYFAENAQVQMAPKFTSPIEAKSFMSSLGFFAGSRMHATIGAISAGVATLPLAYSRKFSGVFGTIQYPHTLDLYGDVAQAEIERQFFAQFDQNLETLTQEAEQAGQQAKQHLATYRRFLQEQLT